MAAPVLDHPATIARCLDLYKAAAVATIAAELGLPAASSSTKAVRIRAIVAFVNSQACTRFLVGRLTADHWSVLRVERLRYEPVRLSALIDRLVVVGLSPARALEIVADLLRKAALVPVGRPEWGQLDLVTPGRDNSRLMVAVPPRIADVATKQPAPPLPSVAAASPPKIEPSDMTAVQREVFLALLIAGRQGIRITNKLLPHKVDVTRLAQAVSGSPTNSPRGKTSKRTVNPWPRLWFSLALLHGSPLVSDDDFVYRPTDAGRAFQRRRVSEQAKVLYEAWLDSPWSELHRVPHLILADSFSDQWHWADDAAVWVETEIPSRVALRRAREVIVSTLRALASSPSDREAWLDVAKFANAIRLSEPEFLIRFGNLGGNYGYYRDGDNRSGTYYLGISRRGDHEEALPLLRGDDWNSVEGGYVANVIAEPLHWLGLVDLGHDASGALVSFRLTSLARHILFGEPLTEERAAGPRLVVQPSFEIIVLDASNDLDLVATVDEFAERQTLDRAAVYRLTRDSIVAGLDTGLSGADIVRTLEAASGTALPQNVAYTLGEWVYQYERFHIRHDAILLEADDPEQLSGWYVDRQVASHLGARLSPSFVHVSAASCDSLLKALTESGHPPIVVDYSRPNRQTLVFQDALSFEVSGGQDDMYQRYRLIKFAELVERKAEVSLYRISRAAATRSGRAGESVALFIEYLKRYLNGPLPADTLLHLYGWSGEIAAVRSADVVAVEAPVTISWPQLLTIEEIAACEPHVVSHDLALVRQSRADRLRQVLEERGLTLEVGLELSNSQNEVKDQRASRAPASNSVVGFGFGRAGVATPEAIRSELQSAARKARPVALSLLDAQRRTVTLRMQPLRIYRFAGAYFLQAQCFECPEEHVVAITDIKSVRVE